MTVGRAPRLLFVHSGSPKKRVTFEAAAAMGARVCLLNTGFNWASSYAEETHCTAGLGLGEVVELAARLHVRDPFDGVVTFWEEDVPTCAHIVERLGLRGNRRGAALAARSKYQMRCAFERAGVPVPRFRRFHDRATLLAACRAVGFPAVLKPEFGSDSEWVLRVGSARQALRTFLAIRGEVRVQDCIFPYPDGGFVLEGVLDGPEVSVEGVVQGGEVTIYAIIDKAAMAADSFVEQGETTPSLAPAPLQAEIAAMVRRGVAALGLDDCGVHAEVKLTASGPRLVEIGARMGGDCIHALVRRVYGIDLAVENLRAALGVAVSPAAQPSGFGVSRTVVPERSGFVRLERPPRLRASRNLIELVFTKAHGDAIRVPPHGYDNLAWISVWGRTHREASARLAAYEERVRRAFSIAPAAVFAGHAGAA